MAFSSAAACGCTNSAASSQVQNSALPLLQPPDTTAAPTATTAPAGETVPTTPATQGSTPSSPTPSTPEPTTPAPAPPPAATCALPGSISVEGGSPSVLGGSGGTTMVVSDPVVLSAGPLVDCGHHYWLAMTSSGGGNYTDCEMQGMTDDVSADTLVGDTISVSLEVPPNACG